MDVYSKNSLSGFIGHTISQFILYSYEKLEDSSSFDTDKCIDKYLDDKSQSCEVDDDESVCNTENGFHSSNSDECKNSTQTDRNDQEDVDSDLYVDIDKSELKEALRYMKRLRVNKNDEVEIKYYKDQARLHNMNIKNDVGYNRFVSKIRLDEARSVIYGTWDPEQSEAMWNEINGEEKEIDIIFNDSQIIREEDLLRADKKPEVTLSTHHLVDYISYVNILSPEPSSPKFSYNKKYVLLFGGSQLNESQINETHTNVFSIINANLNFEFSNNLYYSEAQSFRSNWELLDTVNAPEPRAFHGSCIIYASLETPVLAVCGGFTYNRELVSTELYILNLTVQPLVWDVFKTSGPSPPSRYGHSLSYVGSHLVMFGGTDGNELFNDVWSLNINYGIYTEPGKKSSNQWTKVEFGGLIPAPRAFHSCCKAGISSNSPMVVYGGLTQSEPIRNRLYALHDINEKLIWSIIPSYTKCPSEFRVFHTMTFLDNMFVITGGDGYANENVNGIKSMSYSLDGKVFQYIDDSIELSGHSSWSAYGIIYHWGGVKYQNGKMTFDDSISVSNPLAYSDDRNIEEIYFKYIRYASINNMYNEGREEGEASKVEESDVKVDIDVDYNNDNEVKLYNTSETAISQNDKMSTGQEQSLVDQKSHQQENTEVSSPVSKIESTAATTPLHSADVVSKPGTMAFQSTQPPNIVSPYQPRPRRSAALKCLTAIEIDNLKHREQERLKENPDN